MTWTNILKLKIEALQGERPIRKPERKRRKIPMVGGKDPSKIKDIDEDSLDYVDEDYENMLAASTYIQLKDAFEERLNELTKEELIEILVKTQGIVKLKKPKF